MSATEHRIFAAFVVPLETVELEWIGTLCCLWSQIEYCVEVGIYHLQGLSFIEGRQTELPRDISAKATKLAALAGDQCQGRERRAFLDACERIGEAAPLRNLVVHGHWARLSDHNNAVAAVSWFKVPVDEKISRILPDQLPAITTEAGAISRALFELLDARGAFKTIAQ